ncbi:Tripartite ATP-independent periplasmic transporter, DctQ component [Moorella glycerini]|uniref:2,3-diketo-L-gulonate TRAP transporter small permease protein YiaM n=1 Tax=Neomoorella stamsii TaxID=1266720 RepID=A0A9X7J507_9FIRM|nr:MULTISPECIES: TRAP transporter small permease [Moorella]PRR77107.1 2,3-diketo-L-gulonate TRAP transporter small permease protein YiaM [Moorella stamsii]CEP66856.1 Tripartite ATP-independent periplasmic transporter, DctQ component [Moorella glycerini]
MVGDGFGKWISSILRFLSALLVLSLILLLFINVIMRYFFHYAWPWAEEITLFGLVWMVFLGIPVLTFRNNHIRIDLIKNVLSRALFTKVELFIGVFEVFVAVLSTYYGFILVKKVAVAKQISPAAHWPVWVVSLAMPLGFLMVVPMAIISKLRLYHVWKHGLEAKEVKAEDSDYYRL